MLRIKNRKPCLAAYPPAMPFQRLTLCLEIPSPQTSEIKRPERKAFYALIQTLQGFYENTPAARVDSG